ncbi:uncharacterized protein [Chironomus tepperi]|uniref:uncharacterized protein n=1 Tax=Chironomus tepperi TaxID=113505 RepID=UPI00391F9EAD
MSCLPFAKKLFKFGRKISNMALKIKTTNYNALNSPKNSYYFPEYLDSEIDKHLTGSYSSSSGYISPKLSEASFDDFSKFENNRGKENDLNSWFDSFSLDEKSTALPKHWKTPENSLNWEQSVNLLFDPNSKQFIDFENFFQSSHEFSDCSLFSYSPLSSLESISNDQNYNDLYSNDLSIQMQQECIRREFEMNGKNVDEPPVEETFQPLAISTPFVERKSEQYKYNNSNNNASTKVETEPTKFALSKKHQLSAMSVPFQPYNNIKGNIEMIQFDGIYPPPYLVPSIPFENKAGSNIQGRKRGHQTQSKGVLQNQLLTINTNNSNQKFGTANEKKMDKKNSNKKKKMDDHCVFCKNNGVDEILYRSHTVKDSKGRVLCPKLRAYQCPICGADGDQSHTVKYCPKKPIITMEDLKNLEASKNIGYASSRF